jgi:hypothetical protein
VIELPPGFDPSATGRGPRQLRRWYEVKCTDGEVFVGRWLQVDHRDPDRAYHILSFADDEWIYDIPYGEIVSCLPMHAGYRAQEIEDRQARDDYRRRRREGRRRHRRER